MEFDKAATKFDRVDTKPDEVAMQFSEDVTKFEKLLAPICEVPTKFL